MVLDVETLVLGGLWCLHKFCLSSGMCEFHVPFYDLCVVFFEH